MAGPLHILVENSGPDLWDVGVAVGSALVGAVAGAVPAFILAKRSSKEVLERDRQARRDTERAAGLRVHVKLRTLAGSVIILDKHLRDCLAKQTQHTELWSVVTPIAGFGESDRTHFEPDELALFLSASRGDFADRLYLLSMSHSAQIAGFEDYMQRRQKLSDDLPGPDSISGNVGTTYIRQRQNLLKVRPQMIAANELLAGMLPLVDENRAEALKLSQELGPLLKSYLNDEGFPTIGFGDHILAEHAPLTSIRPPEPF